MIDEHEELNNLIKPVVEYLCNNHHPHTHIIIECDGFELSEWCISGRITEYIKD